MSMQYGREMRFNPDFGKKEVRDWMGENQQFLVDKGVRGVWKI